MTNYDTNQGKTVTDKTVQLKFVTMFFSNIGTSLARKNPETK